MLSPWTGGQTAASSPVSVDGLAPASSRESEQPRRLSTSSPPTCSLLSQSSSSPLARWTDHPYPALGYRIPSHPSCSEDATRESSRPPRPHQVFLSLWFTPIHILPSLRLSPLVTPLSLHLPAPSPPSFRSLGPGEHRLLTLSPTSLCQAPPFPLPALFFLLTPVLLQNLTRFAGAGCLPRINLPEGRDWVYFIHGCHLAI